MIGLSISSGISSFELVTEKFNASRIQLEWRGDISK